MRAPLSMRALLLSSVLLLAACGSTGFIHPPPSDRFYYPTGVAHVQQPGSVNGVLYVASGNWDKRYDVSNLLAVDLDQVRDANGAGLPALGSVPDGGLAILGSLNLASGSEVYIQTFAGQVGAFPLPDGRTRLFVPSRAEGDPLQIIDAAGDQLSCVFPDAAHDRNCFTNAPSLAANERSPSSPGVPAAPGPYGVGFSPDGDLFITHMIQADKPPGSLTNLQTFLVRLNALSPPPSIPDSAFIPIGDIGSYGVVVGTRYAFVSGLQVPYQDIGLEPDAMLRLVDRQASQELCYPGIGYCNPFLRAQFDAVEARGLALSADEQTLYLVTRTPDSLLVLHVQGATTASPSVVVERVVPLPAGASEVAAIHRPGQGDLLVISCETAGEVVLYDEDQGVLAAEIAGVGNDPFGIAADVRNPLLGESCPSSASCARVYVTNFGDGTVSVIDIPDLAVPQQAELVARIGKPQTCLVLPNDPSCQGVAP